MQKLIATSFRFHFDAPFNNLFSLIQFNLLWKIFPIRITSCCAHADQLFIYYSVLFVAINGEKKVMLAILGQLAHNMR